MKDLSGKIIETRSCISGDNATHLGTRLRELRGLASLTQAELANKMGVSRSAISNIENRADIGIVALQKYIVGLGANLRVDASFDSNSKVALHIKDAFDLDELDENQLVLPILDDEKFRPQRDVVLSIKPRYSEPIIEGLKTVELRRRFPINVPKGTLMYIYSTSPTRALTGIAEIEKVSKIPLEKMWNDFSDVACIPKDDFDSYFSGLEEGFVISLKNAKPLSREIGLEELRDRFEFEAPQSFIYAKPVLREALKHESSTLLN